MSILVSFISGLVGFISGIIASIVAAYIWTVRRRPFTLRVRKFLSKALWVVIAVLTLGIYKRWRRLVKPRKPQLAKVEASEDFIFRGGNEADVVIKKEDYRTFYISIYLVTNEEYKRFIDNTDSRPPSFWEGRDYPEGYGDHPVHSISLEEAKAYCRWLSESRKERYRLPTEQEWERAARGTDGREYPWGREFDERKCNFKGSPVMDTTPVNCFPNGKSPCGCFDMVGNVMEFTGTVDMDKDGYEYFIIRSSHYESLAEDSNCIARQPFPKGAVNERLQYSRVGFRVNNEGVQCSRVGFRVVWEGK